MTRCPQLRKLAFFAACVTGGDEFIKVVHLWTALCGRGRWMRENLYIGTTYKFRVLLVTKGLEGKKERVSGGST